MTSRQIKTDGGAYIEGEAKTDGGDFIGRDKNVITDVKGNVHIGNIIYQKTKVEEFREALEDRIKDHAFNLILKFQRAELAQPHEPYRHLNFFDLEHKNIFFGRDEALRELVSLICANNQFSQLTLIHAPSGAGKTSLLRVMQPELQKQGTLPLYIFHPQEPVHTIKQTIFPDSPHPDILDDLPLHTFLSWASDPLRKKDLSLILILDQFEEFFIQLAEAQRRAFISSLKVCHEVADLPVKFVLAMRKDYFSDMDQFGIKTIYDNRFLLPPLTREQAREAIEGPIQGKPVKWEEASIERLLDNLAKGKMDPPQLQLICATRYKQLHLEEKKTLLTVSEEDLQSIYSDFLSKVMDLPDDDPDFPKDQRDLGWRLLKSHLITSHNTKISMPLVQLFKQIAPEPELNPVIDYLVDNRVLRRDTNAEGQPIVEITHDTLAEEIASRETKEEQREKLARELVNRELTVWLHFEKSLEYLMNKNTLKTLNNHREYLVQPTTEMLEFLFRSALAIGFEAEYWFEQAQAGEVNVELILLEYLKSKNFRERELSLTLLANLKGDYLPLLQGLLLDQYSKIRQAAICQLEQRYPSGEWRESLVYERYIPAGKFIIGNPEEDGHAEIYLDAFYIGRHPVTNADYKRYMDNIGRDFDMPKNRDDHPVVNVSLEEAEAYAKWANMRLLNEAEWEKAASWDEFSSVDNPKKRVYPWGNCFEPKLCNTLVTHEVTTPVGYFSDKGGDSAYGVADLTGNVWEWTSSQFSNNPLFNKSISGGVANTAFQGLGFSELGPYGDGNVSVSHHLFGMILEHFDLSEFQNLCDELSILYDNLPGRSLLCKVKELIKHFQQERRLDTLAEAIKSSRPHLYEPLKNIQLEIITDIDLKIDILNWILVNCFSKDELLDLCLEFIANYDYLLTVSHAERASELLNYLEYYGWLGYLDNELQKLRPNVINKFGSSTNSVLVSR